MPTRTNRPTQAEAGSSTVELAVLAPVALVLLLGVLQAGLWLHTRSLCTHAAQQGTSAAATVTGDNAAGEQAATAFLARSPSAATHPDVSVNAGSADVTVRVRATAPLVLPIPGLQIPVEGLSHAGKERFTTPGSRP